MDDDLSPVSERPGAGPQDRPWRGPAGRARVQDHHLARAPMSSASEGYAVSEGCQGRGTRGLARSPGVISSAGTGRLTRKP
jgi:hypothetical protein